LKDRAGELLVYNYNDKLRAYLVDLENAIHNMIDFSELDDSEFDRSEKDVNRQFEEAKRKIPEHLRVNRTIISDSQIKWSHHIRQEIENNIDTLVNAYLAGRTINSEITHIVKGSLICTSFGSLKCTTSFNFAENLTAFWSVAEKSCQGTFRSLA